MTTPFTYQNISVLSPVGSVIAYMGTNAPSGWLLCNGAAYDTVKYSELHTLIGGTYGSNTPNLAGLFIMGAGINTGAGGNAGTFNNLSVAGRSSVTLTNYELPSHSHNLTNGTALKYNNSINPIDKLYNIVSEDYGTNPGSNYGAFVYGGSAHSYSTMTLGNTDANGSGNSFNILPSYVAMTYIIKF